MALFGGTSSSRQSRNLVEFRAGKMTMKGNLVSPDKRKGLVYVYQSDDGLTHFCWKDRKAENPEDDLIVFPDDCEYKKVTQCKEGSRVFLLKFKTSARKHFFWMQEPKSDGDDDLLWKVNESLNNPGAMSSNGRGGHSGNGTPTASDSDMAALLQSMSQSQLMQLLGGMGNMSELGGSAGLLSQLQQLGGLSGSGGGSRGSDSTVTSSAHPTSPVSAPVPKTEQSKSSTTSSSNSKGSTPAIQLHDLQKILSNINPSAPPVAVDLSTSVSRDVIRRITSSPATVKKLAPLLPQFGGPDDAENEASPTEIEETLVSPQFQQALSAFCAAFPTGQLGPLIQQFEMGSDAVSAAQTGNLEAFLNAIQKEAQTPGEKESPAPATEEAEDMNID